MGLWGTSQGGLLAAAVAARDPLVQFVAVVSAPGYPVGESAAYQDSIRLVNLGFDDADVVRACSLNHRLYGWLRTGDGEDELSALLANASGTEWRRATSLPPRLPSRVERESWYWGGRLEDPMSWWRQVSAPGTIVSRAGEMV